ncbi:MAG: pseudaminic acid synthase [Thermodesulfobacteriota bacterium]
MGKGAGELVVNGRLIGVEEPPFVIAEMSGNHNQSLDTALAIVDAVAATGAHALKLQTYTPDSLTIDARSESFLIDDPKSLWHDRSLYQLYEQAHTPWEWHEAIFRRCRDLGLTVFSTPFDEAAVDRLESMGVPAYKIASFENNHLPLIRKVAATGKPLFLSTGMATVAELDEAVATARGAGCDRLVLLKCTSTYPAAADTINLATLPHLRQLFTAEVGLSDHTRGIGVAVAAVAMGATVIEKHFTLSRAAGGVDAAFSMEPHEMRQLVAESLQAWQALGRVAYGVTTAEAPSLRFRRSIYVVEDVRRGEELNEHNLRIIRPGDGLAPKYYGLILGRRASRDIRKGTPLDWAAVLDG